MQSLESTKTNLFLGISIMKGNKLKQLLKIEEANAKR